MSDVSNPIASSDRFTFDTIIKDEMLRKRQDFRYLETLVRGGERVYAPELPDFSIPSNSTVGRLVKVDLSVDKGPIPLSITPTISYDKENKPVPVKMPVSAYHPSGIHQEKGFVSLVKNFKVPKRNEALIRALLRYQPLAEEIITRRVMSTGTKSGFAKRLLRWYDHKTPDQPKVIREQTGYSFVEVLKEHMPLEGVLPDWNQPIYDLIAKVKVTKSSSAGPPLYTSKVDCWTEVLKIMDDFIQAANQDTLQEFLNRNPEMLMGDCRNKADRYNTSEIMEKCRPYWCFSTAVSIFVSFLMQSFCERLQLFSENDESWNGYGFSLPHGGGKKILEWMSRTKEGQAKCAIYGDDVMLVRRKNGKLKVFMPDFSQMDASVSLSAIKHTMTYVQSQFERQWGKNPFWETISALGVIMAGDSNFMVEGTSVYHKSGGLRTGVVGTTVYDTALSIVAYKSLIHLRIDLEDESAVKKHLLLYGLEIKGEWKGSAVNENPQIGERICEEKWLGAYFEVHAGGSFNEPIPCVSQEELTCLIGNARITERGKMSDLVEQRTLFDMARGYMITGAYLYDELYASLSYIINNTPSVVVVMRVMENKGTGTPPELHMFSGEEFIWPSSDGFPDKDFCKNVFLSPNNKVKGKWIEIFPTLVKELKSFRKTVETVPPIKDDKKWKTEILALDVAEKVEELKNPTIPASIYELPPLVTEKPTRPKKMLTFKQEVTSETKQDHIRAFTVIYETVHGRFLEDVFPHYPVPFIAETMINEEWYPDSEGYWTRNKIEKVKVNGKYWSSGALSMIMQKKLAEKDAVTPSVSSEVTLIGDPLEFVADGLDLQRLREKLGPQEDPISSVSAAFVTLGIRLMDKSEVIGLSPTPWIRYTLETSVGKLIGFAENTNKKNSKLNLFKKLRKKIEDEQ